MRFRGLGFRGFGKSKKKKDGLRVAADGAIEPLVVAIHDHHEVIEPFKPGFRLQGLGSRF